PPDPGPAAGAGLACGHDATAGGRVLAGARGPGDAGQRARRASASNGRRRQPDPESEWDRPGHRDPGADPNCAAARVSVRAAGPPTPGAVLVGAGGAAAGDPGAEPAVSRRSGLP